MSSQSADQEEGSNRPKRSLCCDCGRPATVCLCDAFPKTPLSLKGFVVVLQHPLENRRKLATVPLLSRCINNCMVVTGRKLREGSNATLDHLLQSVAAAQLPMYVLFPGPGAVDLAVVAASPLHQQALLQHPSAEEDFHPAYVLLAIDGTWQQAREMFVDTASHWLPPHGPCLRVALPSSSTSTPGLPLEAAPLPKPRRRKRNRNRYRRDGKDNGRTREDATADPAESAAAQGSATSVEAAPRTSDPQLIGAEPSRQHEHSGGRQSQEPSPLALPPSTGLSWQQHTSMTQTDQEPAPPFALPASITSHQQDPASQAHNVLCAVHNAPEVSHDSSSVACCATSPVLSSFDSARTAAEGHSIPQPVPLQTTEHAVVQQPALCSQMGQPQRQCCCVPHHNGGEQAAEGTMGCMPSKPASDDDSDIASGTGGMGGDGGACMPCSPPSDIDCDTAAVPGGVDRGLDGGAGACMPRSPAFDDDRDTAAGHGGGGAAQPSRVCALRSQPWEGCCTTMEAVARALALLERDEQLLAPMLAPLERMTEFQAAHNPSIRARMEGGQLVAGTRRRLGARRPPITSDVSQLQLLGALNLGD